MSDSDDVTKPELVAFVSYLLGIGAMFATAVLNLGAHSRLWASLLMAASTGLLVGVLATADVEEHTPTRAAIPFIVLAVSAVVAGAIGLPTAILSPFRYSTAVYTSVAWLVAGFVLLQAAMYLDGNYSSSSGGPENPEGILDDGGDT